MKNFKKISTIVAGLLLGPAMAYAATFIVPQGGTGAGTFTAGNLLYGAGTAALHTVATTTLVAGTNITFTGGTPVVVGSSPVTINASGSAGGIGTTSPWTAGYAAYVVNDSTVSSVATSTITFSGPFNGYSTLGALLGGSASTITWTGLATTTQPSTSNLLVSDGGAGVYGVATSTLTATSPLTGSFTQIGSGGALGCQTASGAQAGCLSAADWTTFNAKQAAGFQISTTSPISVSNLAYFTGTTPTSIGGVATSTLTAGTGLTGSFTQIGSGGTLALTTPVVIANGGTATTTFYSGGLTFFNGSTISQAGQLGQNSLFWDATNFRLGISSSTPSRALSVGSGIASSSISVAEYAYGRSGNVATSTAATITPRASNTIRWPLGTSGTTLTLCNFNPGDTLKVIVANPAAGTAGTITWAVCSGYQLYWAAGTAPTQTTTAGKNDVWSFIATQAVGSTTPSTIEIFGAQSANF